MTKWRVLVREGPRSKWEQLDQDLTEGEAILLLDCARFHEARATPNMTDDEAPIWNVVVEGVGTVAVGLPAADAMKVAASVRDSSNRRVSVVAQRS